MATFGYNFGTGSKDLTEVGKENVKSAIRDYFDSRSDTEIIEFAGNVSPPPGDIMRVLVDVPRESGYGVIEDLKGRRLDHGVNIIQGGVE